MGETTKDNKTKGTLGFAAIGKSISGITAKAQESLLNVVDRNGDGKIDGEDFGLTAENIQEVKDRAGKMAAAAGQGIKAGSEFLGKAIAESKLDKERKTLRPVFFDDLTTEAALPNMLRLVDHDKRRDESPLCSGSVGYWEAVKGMDTLCIYADCISQFELDFYPSTDVGIFYVDPYRKHLFVRIDSYFDFLKKARVNELELIAQKLGAKRVQIAFKENAQKIEKKKAQAEVKAVYAGTTEISSATVSQAGSDYSAVEIATDLVFSGHEKPEIPEVIYYRNESDIEKLIEMRISGGENKIQSKTYRFKCGKSTGIKEDEAVKIDAIAGQLKCNASQSFSREIQRENRTELEYKIEF